MKRRDTAVPGIVMLVMIVALVGMCCVDNADAQTAEADTLDGYAWLIHEPMNIRLLGIINCRLIDHDMMAVPMAKWLALNSGEQVRMM